MSKIPFKKINRLIIKIITLLEQDVEELDPGNIKIKKDISSTLSRLVTLAMQLNKLMDNSVKTNSQSLSKRDVEIIENFIEKYRN